MGEADGKEVILGILGPGEIFGEMGLIDDGPRSASVVWILTIPHVYAADAGLGRAIVNAILEDLAGNLPGCLACDVEERAA